MSDSDLDASLTTAASPHLTDFVVRFWGVRGSIPTPSVETVRYGGNTACVEMLIHGHRLIFDGGTGLRVLGKHLLQLPQPIEAHLFFTHTHWDRIQGFPFFIPAFLNHNRFFIYGATAQNGASIKQRLTEQMLRPNFPTPLQMMQSQLHFKTITPGSIMPISDEVTVEAILLNRLNSALGYRVTCGDLAVVYATDTDHTTAEVDQALIYLAQGADLLIYDGTYADHAYHDPNTTQAASDQAWQAAIALAKAAQVKKLVLFYHDPNHDDDQLDRLAEQVRSNLPNVMVAREGLQLQVGEISEYSP